MGKSNPAPLEHDKYVELPGHTTQMVDVLATRQIRPGVIHLQGWYSVLALPFLQLPVYAPLYARFYARFYAPVYAPVCVLTVNNL